MTVKQSDGLSAHPVLLLEAQRCEAMMSADLTALNRVFSESLTYVHSTGTVHNYAQFTAYLKDTMRFEVVQRAGLVVAHYGSIAICTGLMKIAGVRKTDDQRFTSVSFVTQAWTNHGTGWRISLMQSTKIDDALWDEAIVRHTRN